jgi:hypothetical protein
VCIHRNGNDEHVLFASSAHTVWKLALFISRHQALRLCREMNLQSSSKIIVSIQIPYDFGQESKFLSRQVFIFQVIY